MASKSVDLCLLVQNKLVLLYNIWYLSLTTIKADSTMPTWYQNSISRLIEAYHAIDVLNGTLNCFLTKFNFIIVTLKIMRHFRSFSISVLLNLQVFSLTRELEATALINNLLSNHILMMLSNRTIVHFLLCRVKDRLFLSIRCMLSISTYFCLGRRVKNCNSSISLLVLHLRVGC